MPRNCNCSGPCGPQYVNPDGEEAEDGVSRREFISLASIGAAGALLAGASPEAPAAAAAAAAAEDLADWKKSLMKPAAPRRYRSGTHGDAKMHLGGIGTGNFEIGADGQFTTWQLFNTLRDGFVPLCFGVMAGKTAKILQTVGGPEGVDRIKSIEMTGEYPIATLRFDDRDLPVQLEMTAFTPFAPLDTEFSSMPVACFLFKVHNPTGSEQTVSLGAFMQNPVGYDAMGVPISFNSVGFNSVAARWTPDHPNFGGNYNELLHNGNVTVLCMGMEGSSGAKIDRPLSVFTNLPVEPFHAPYELRPAMLTVQGLQALPGGSAPDAEQRSTPLIWLEDAATDLPIGTLRAAVAAVRAGATLVFSGKTMPLLRHYAELTGGKPLDKTTLRPDILFDDFESGYGKWTVEGTAFGDRPPRGTLQSQQQVTGFLGIGLVNSFRDGDDTTGKMTSKPFKIERHFIRFLVGGGSSPGTQIRLRVDGKTVRAASGKNEERLLPAFWDVRDLQGKEAHIEIVDETKGGWGHINVDHIEFGDLAGSVEVLELLDEILPARFSGVRALPDAGEGSRVEFQNVVRREGVEEKRTGADHTLLAHQIDRGKVILASGPILDHDHIELIGARNAAYRALAGIAGAKLVGAERIPSGAPGNGTLALGVRAATTRYKMEFIDWKEAWNEFRNQRFPVPHVQSPLPGSNPTTTGQTCNGAIAAEITVPPGKTVEVPFVLSWYYPNKYSNRGENMGCYYTAKPGGHDALPTAVRALRDFETLRSRTERFRSVFYDSTLPYWMLDCITSQVATIRHIGVVFRIANGDCYGWEGSNGCCDPTCTHVWGYVQNVARLFPDIERDMRRIDFKHQQGPNGGVNNRTVFPSPPHPTGEHPFADGHASCVLKLYREALNTPGDAYLKEYWPNAKRGVEYLMDRDAATSGGKPNGLLEDDQWNTYDEALHGVTTFIGTYYLAALRAGEEWAKRVCDGAFADRCRAVFAQGRQNLVDRCWNGEYFQQNLPGYEKMNGEVGPGCMSDQLIGQWWAHQLGLGYLLPEVKVKAALQAVYKYNWMPDLTGWKHNPRAFAGAKDRGLIICTWPKGGRPPGVMLYSDEVWTGIEYQVAAHMLYEGMMEEGFAVVKGARDRYDGVPRAPMPRSPWNEIECGGHYVRAGSSWSLLLALSGWLYDGDTGHLELRPRHTPNSFKSFFTGPQGWGSVSQTRKGAQQRNEIKVVEGKLDIRHMRLDAVKAPKSVQVTLAGKAVPATVKSADDGLTLEFVAPITVHDGQTLAVRLS